MSTVKTKLENKTWLGGEKIETMARAESLMVKGKETVIKSRKVFYFCFCFVIVVVVLGQGRSYHIREQERENRKKRPSLGVK